MPNDPAMVVQMFGLDMERRQIEAAMKFKERGQHTFRLLLQALKSSDIHVKRSACLALAELGDSQAVEDLINATEDEDAYVRSYAAAALGRIGDHRGIDPLAKILVSNFEGRFGGPHVFILSEKKVIKPSAPGVVGEVDADLVEIPPGDLVGVRISAALALAQISGAIALKHLNKALMVEQQCISALTRESTELYESLRKNEETVQAALQEAIRKLLANEK